VKSYERARSAEGKKREPYCAKVSIVETQMRNMWPDAYLMPREAYLIHLRILISEMTALIKATEAEIKRVEN